MLNNSSRHKLSYYSHKIRLMLWPIDRSELKKFLPMAFMMCCILFNLTCLRGLKDTLVVSSIGAESLSFLKVYIVTPVAFLFPLLYIRLLNSFSQEKVFYIIVSIFVGFFMLFGYVLYPNQNLIHPDPSTVNNLVHKFMYIKWLILIWGKWSYIIMYVFAELWGVVILNLMFWQLANKIFETREAKRFYMMFGFIGNLGLIASGELLMHFAKIAKINATSDGLVIKIITITSIVTLILTALYRYMYSNIIPHIKIIQPTINESHKPKPTVAQSIKIIMTSKYLWLILLLIIGYGISINLVEGIWKSKIKELYPTQHEYIGFMGFIGKWVGVGSMISYILGNNILRIFGWLVTATITPIMMLITGLGFFIFCLFQKNFPGLEEFIGYSPLAIAVFLGFIQNVLAKSTKYSLFDAVKEIAYIPLNDELKAKGKAVVDVLGSAFGKSSGAVIQTVLFIIFPMATFNDIIPILMVIFVLVLIVWLYSIKTLHKEYKLLKEKNLALAQQNEQHK